MIMMRSLYNLREPRQNNRPPSKEDGITIVEIMISIVIIAAVLVFTASGLTMSSKSSIAAENRTKATAFANDAIAIAKQAPFRKAFVPPSESDSRLWGNGKCTTPNENETPDGRAASLMETGEGANPFPGLVQCQTRQASNAEGPVGSVFYIQTQVYGISSYNSAGYKEVWVTVRWKDITVPENQWNTVTVTATLAPTVEDCYLTTVGQPVGVTLDALNSAIPGCVYNASNIVDL